MQTDKQADGLATCNDNFTAARHSDHNHHHWGFLTWPK